MPANVILISNKAWWEAAEFLRFYCLFEAAVHKRKHNMTLWYQLPGRIDWSRHVWSRPGKNIYVFEYRSKHIAIYMELSA